MNSDRTRYKKLNHLSFKAHTADLIRADDRSPLKREDEAQFKGRCRTYFEGLNLVENREIARRLGMDGATTVPKEKLVDLLLDKVWGLQYFSDDAPFLREVDINLIDVKTELSILEDFRRGELIIANEVEGVFESAEDGGGIIRVGNFKKNIMDVGVIRSFVGTYKLTTGDFIKGRARYADGIGFFCLFYLESINGITVVGESRPEIAKSECVPPDKRLTLESENSKDLLRLIDMYTPVCYGGCTVLSIEGRVDYNAITCDIYNSIKYSNQADCVIYACLGERDGLVERLSELYKEGVFTSVSDSEEENCRIVKRITSYARQTALNGKNVVVILNTLSRLPKNEIFTAKEFVSAARSYDTGGSVTLICTADRDMPLSPYYDIKDVIDCDIRVKSDFYRQSYSYALLDSYSINNFKRSDNEKKALKILDNVIEKDGAKKSIELLLNYPNNNAFISAVRSGDVSGGDI